MLVTANLGKILGAVFTFRNASYQLSSLTHDDTASRVFLSRCFTRVFFQFSTRNES